MFELWERATLPDLISVEDVTGACGENHGKDYGYNDKLNPRTHRIVFLNCLDIGRHRPMCRQ